MNSCITFKFAAITKGKSLIADTDGILGLWSGNTAATAVEPVDLTTMIIPELVKSTAITQKTFSWYFIGDGGDPYIDFG